MLEILLIGLRRTLALPYRLMVLGTAQSPHFVIAILCLSVCALSLEQRAWLIPLTVFAIPVVSLFSSLCFDNAAAALLPDQPKSAWRGWLGLAMLVFWLIWAGLYWREPAVVHALLGWEPEEHAMDAFERAFIVYLAPLLPVLLNQGYFQFQKVKPAKT